MINNSARKKLEELVSDAETYSSKLTTWENNFIKSMKGLLFRGYDWDDLSAKQKDVCIKLEEKIYATD